MDARVDHFEAEPQWRPIDSAMLLEVSYGGHAIETNSSSCVWSVLRTQANSYERGLAGALDLNLHMLSLTHAELCLWGTGLGKGLHVYMSHISHQEGCQGQLQLSSQLSLWGSEHGCSLPPVQSAASAV